MKKNLIILALVLMVIVSGRAQQLQNTLWICYNTTNTLVNYWQFSTNQLSFSGNNINYTLHSIYQESGNLFTITDIDTFSGCSVTDTGRYNFSILNDTLHFTLISDPCSVWRSFVFVNYYMVRIATGIETLASGSDVFVYPNPSSDGIFNISFRNKKQFDKIIVCNAQSRIVFEENIMGAESSHPINLQYLPSGIYFLILQNDNGKSAFKIVR